MSRSTAAIIVLLLCACIVAIVLILPSPGRDKPFDGTYTVMGTYCRIIIPQAKGDPSRLAESALAQIRNIEALASTYRPDSEVSLLSNLPPNTPRELSPHIYTVLKGSIHYSKLTGGAFDVTVAPLMNLWRAAAVNDVLPSEDQIAEACRTVGYQKIILDDNAQTVQLTDDGMAITLDAIVKGYAVDLALEHLRQAHLPGALVEIGGDIACYGAPAGRKAWTIGIQNPFAPATGLAIANASSAHILAAIELTDAAVATSGNYQRFFSIQGRDYSHILDPRTGLPVTQAPSVTVIAPTAADADALATSCSVLTVPEALELINQIPQTEALLITGSPDAPVYHTSEGFRAYLRGPLPGGLTSNRP